MIDRIFLSHEQIANAVRRHLRTLTEDKRIEVVDTLDSIRQSGIGREELHKALYKLRKQFDLTEYDVGLVEKEFFA